MLKCSNCNGLVDENAAACPRCGRPGAGKEAASNQATGCLVVVVAVVGFLIYSWFVGGDSANQAQPAQASIQAQPSPTAAPPTSTAPVGDFPNYEPGESSYQESAVVEAPESSPAPVEEFPYDATLTDPRGKVVLQSKASVLSKNVSVLTTGLSVKAESNSGKWIRVKTSDGLVGYVRERQLVF